MSLPTGRFYEVVRFHDSKPNFSQKNSERESTHNWEAVLSEIQITTQLGPITETRVCG